MVAVPTLSFLAIWPKRIIFSSDISKNRFRNSGIKLGNLEGGPSFIVQILV